MRRLINFFFGKRAVQALQKAKETPPKKQTLWNRIMTKHLLLFNTVSSGGLMLFGDVAAQTIEQRLGEKTDGYDLARIARMTIVGTFQGPMHHYFYGWVDKIMPKNDGKEVFKKIMLDQFVASPLFIVSYFYPASLMEGMTMNEAHEDFQSKFWTVYKADWLIWPPCQFINFYFLPLQYRVLYINAITTLYNVFLCYVKHQQHKKSDKSS
ncbi:mpv17-like protein 2 [Culicoides brevitarsis]|uniref:mpv17-like protein 2 n=1 Tax=Culicoides brevitarsis TaxID=469753 RepID=UPI00307C0BD2